MFVREGVNFGGKELTIETGRMAKQADGAVVVRYGDTMVLVTAVASSSIRARRGLHAAHGRLPREDLGGRPHPRRLLQARGPHDRGRGAHLAHHRPPEPASVPQGLALRHAGHRHGRLDRPRELLRRARHGGRVVLRCTSATSPGRARTPACASRASDGQFVVNPTFTQRDEADLDLVVAANRDAIVMVEGSCSELGEDVIVDALMFAHQAAQPLLDLQEKLRAAVGKPKREFTPPQKDPAIVSRVAAVANEKISAAMAIRDKHERYGALDAAGAADRRGAHARVPRPRRRDQGGLRVGQEEAPARARARHAAPHRRPRHGRHPRHHLRGRRAAAPARVVAVHARRDAGARHGDPRHEPGHAAHRGHHGRHREALPAALQLPALLDG